VKAFPSGGVPPAPRIFLPKRVHSFRAFANQRGDSFGIELDHGQGRKESPDRQRAGPAIFKSHPAGRQQRSGISLQDMNQQVLQGCNVGGLSAHTALFTSRPLRRLLALKTKHFILLSRRDAGAVRFGHAYPAPSRESLT
jgi:hypothetical protein